MSVLKHLVQKERLREQGLFSLGKAKWVIQGNRITLFNFIMEDHREDGSKPSINFIQA